MAAHREGEYVTCTIDRLSGGRYVAVNGDSDGNPPEFNHRMAAQAYPSAGLADARALDDMLDRARVHHVKISNFWADAHATGKNWEIRCNDRDYEVGDRLVMHAADGRVISTKVLHVWWSVRGLADLCRISKGSPRHATRSWMRAPARAAGYVILDVSPGFAEVKEDDEAGDDA